MANVATRRSSCFRRCLMRMARGPPTQSWSPVRAGTVGRLFEFDCEAFTRQGLLELPAFQLLACDDFFENETNPSPDFAEWDPARSRRCHPPSGWNRGHGLELLGIQKLCIGSSSARARFRCLRGHERASRRQRRIECGAIHDENSETRDRKNNGVCHTVNRSSPRADTGWCSHWQHGVGP